MPADSKHRRALRQKAEKLLSETPEKLALMSGTDLKELVHELSVNRIELEIQNEQLRISQEQLEQSRSEYADLYDFAPVGYLTFDERGLISRVNLTAADLLGIERSLLAEKPFAAFIHPESQDLFYLHRQKVAKTTTTQTCQLVLKRSKGGEAFFHAQLESIAAHANGNTTIRTVLTDITEHKLADEKLKASEARHRRLFESPVIGILYANVERITDANDMFLETIGYTREELEAGQIDWRKMTPPEYASRDENGLRQLAETGYAVPFEREYFRKDGTRVPMLIGAALLEREPLAWVCFVIDMSERRRTEEALRRQADLLDLAHCAILVRDMESRITFWNHRAEELYGWTKAEATGHVADTFLKTRFPVPFDEYMAALTREGHWEGELVHTIKDGRQITVLSRQALQRDDAGDPLVVLEINLDITKARRTEQELRQAHKMEALGTLTGGIAHDFNNILASMIGFTELAADRALKGSRQEHCLQRVLDAGLRGRDLIKRMLIFSRKTEQERVPLQLGSLVKETMKLLRASIPSTVKISVKIGSKSGLILADPTQIQQVIMNLCTNGAYAIQEKGGTLDVELGDCSVPPPDEMKPGPYLRLVVRDTGVGIPADIMDKIFDPFFTTKKQGAGTGLGLSVVHGIVEQHDGYITVISEPEKGSTFTVYFPKVKERPHVKTIGEESIPTGHERILFIDDEEDLADIASEMLTDLGYRVESKTSSREALAILRLDPSRFDLVITDQTMPDMTGVELAKEILALRTDMPIILCTGFSHTASEESVRAAGIKGFVMKPLTKREIARTIRKVLDG